MQGEAAPAAADLQDVVLGAKAKLVANVLQLGLLCFGEVVAAFRPARARIRQGLVEEEPEEFVAEVVGRLNVALAAGHGVDPQPVAPGVQQARDETGVRVQPQPRAVAQHLLQQGREVVAGPLAGHVGLTSAGRSAQQHPGKEARVVNAHENPAPSIARAEVAPRPVGEFDPQRAAGPLTEAAEDDDAGRSVDEVGHLKR